MTSDQIFDLVTKWGFAGIGFVVVIGILLGGYKVFVLFFSSKEEKEGLVVQFFKQLTLHLATVDQNLEKDMEYKQGDYEFKNELEKILKSLESNVKLLQADSKKLKGVREKLANYPDIAFKSLVKMIDTIATMVPGAKKESAIKQLKIDLKEIIMEATDE